MSELVVATTDEQVEAIRAEGQFALDLSDEKKSKVHSKAVAFVEGTRAVQAGTRGFQEQVDAINSIAEKEVSLSGAGAARILSKKSSTSNKAREFGSEAAMQAHNTLTDLGMVVKDLNGAPGTFIERILPANARKRLQRTIARTKTADDQLKGIVEELHNSGEELAMDNASLMVEQEQLKKAVEDLNEYVALASEIEAELVTEIENLRADGQEAEASARESSMLFAVRRRKQDLITQMGVASQSYMAMGIIIANNHELIQGVKRASTSTVAVLRTAMVTAEALATQERIVNALDTLDEGTNALMVSNAKQMQTNAGRIQQKSINSGIRADVLQQSFDAVFATVEDMERLRKEALPQISAQVEGLERVLSSVQPRMRALNAGAGEQPTVPQRKAITLD